MVPLAITLGLGGCASISEKMASTMSQMPGIGMSADVPDRPTPTAFPAVHDIPPPRNSVTLTNMEQQQMEDDLVTARDRQQSAAGVPLQPKKQAKPAAITTPVSSRSIY